MSLYDCLQITLSLLLRKPGNPNHTTFGMYDLDIILVSVRLWVGGPGGI